MVHELRTPINGIIGSLKMIIDGFIDDEPELEREELEQEFIADAHHRALRLLDMINGLLDVVKIEAGRLSIELLAPVKLYELLTEVENFVQTQTQKKQLNFQIIKPTTQDEIITYGHYYRLREVMLTLVGDAIKYTDEGGITIVVEMIEQKIVLKNQEHPGLVKIHIANDKYKYGQYSLLRFFQQMNNTSIYQWYCTPAFGLAISKTLIEAMNGEFYFDVKGQGDSAAVTISLPLYQKTLMT
jgi:signal transduction histidine kinase